MLNNIYHIDGIQQHRYDAGISKVFVDTMMEAFVVAAGLTRIYFNKCNHTEKRRKLKTEKSRQYQKTKL